MRVQGGARGIFAARHPAQPFPNPEKQADRFALIRVKGQCPLRVQGGARGIFAARHPAQPFPNPEKQADRFAPIQVKGGNPLWVQGGARGILAARQSPPQAYLTPNKKTGSFAPTRVKGQCPLRVQGGARGIFAVRHPAQPFPNPEKQAERLALFIAARQLSPQAYLSPPISKPTGLRRTAVRRLYAIGEN